VRNSNKVDTPVKITVAIPTYNSTATIRPTLESVLRQTVKADEILVLDDGSTDDTISILKSYEPRIKLFRQENQGVAGARNALCARANGDLIAFLDHDDIWHPSYLEMQRNLFVKYPDAAAFFTAHVNFNGYGAYEWNGAATMNHPLEAELLAPLDFLRRYNETTGPFGSMSYCCVPKYVLTEIGSEPFKLSGVDDSYLCTQLPLLGRPVVFASLPLVAYRITREAQSTNKLKAFAQWVEIFRILEPRYQRIDRLDLCDAFEVAFASKRRSYAKLLMGADEKSEARHQLRESLSNSPDPISRLKSLGLLTLTHMPIALQPRWPSSYRQQGG
jgi:glycosyltransferase involved in cell wall biosynthesis